jgi:phenylpropionate dioxygenase-like ring-hydroxylating dioxygenase large terminal subunit
MGFLQNTWYMAAFDYELNHTLLARRIADVPIVLWRNEDGSISALHDVCPHRFLPLSKGTRIGDEVQCWYHGLRFNSAGKCTAIPGQETIPKAAKVKTYPLVEQHGCAWVWLGDPALADESLIPNYFYHNSDEWVDMGHSMLFVDGHCQLVVDNLLDLTHIATVHAQTVGNDEQTTAEVTTTADDGSVTVARWIPDQPPVPIWSKAFNNYKDNVDHWQNMRWEPPGYFFMDVGVTPAGRPKEEGFGILASHIIVPSHPNGCYYFWHIARRNDFRARGLDENMTSAIDFTFHEDQVIINIQQQLLNELNVDDLAEGYTFPLTTESDLGAIKSRRLMERLLKAEETDQSSTESGLRSVGN